MMSIRTVNHVTEIDIAMNFPPAVSSPRFEMKADDVIRC